MASCDTEIRRKNDSLFTGFLKSNLGWIITLLITSAAFYREQGRRDEIISSLQRSVSELAVKIEHMDAIGSNYDQRTRWQSDEQKINIQDLTGRANKVDEALNQMRTDIRLIASWVEEQKNRPRASTP